MTRLSRAARPLLWATLAVATAFLYDPLDRPLSRDARGQFYIAERAAAGVPPHASSITAKNGLAFLLAGGAIRVGRVAGISDVYAVRAWGILLLAATVGLAWLVANGLAGPRAGDLAALLVLAVPAYVAAAGVGLQPKLLLVVAQLLAGLAIAHRRWAWAGAAGAVAFLCWQPGFIVLVAAALAALAGGARRTDVAPGPPGADLRRGTLRADLARLGAGALAVVTAYEAYYLTHGLLTEQLHQSIVLPLRFMTAERPGLGEAIRRAAAAAADGFRVATVAIPLAALWATDFWRTTLGGRGRGDLSREGLPLSRRQGRRRWLDLLRAVEPGPLYWHAGAIAFAAFSLLEVQGAPDLFVFVPYLALGAGAVMGDARRRLPGAVTAAIYTLFVATVLLAPPLRGERRPPPPFDLDDQRALARRVASLRGAEDGVLAFGATHLLAFEHRENWTPYGHWFRGVSEYLEHRYQGRLDPMRRQGRLPGIVLVGRPARLPEPVERELTTRYEPIAAPAFERQAITVYRRRDPGS